MLLILLPDAIRNHGIFIYAGDYFFQQIPFYHHAANVMQNYGIGWDWYTDLGNDFITSYSYYMTGSIFFWIISWLSADLILYAMPVMIAFKTAVGAVGAFAYISRFVKNNNVSFIAALMYSFSGYQMVSLVFNTFHDITALFPFLLLSFEMLVADNKRGFFSFMVGLVALTNYFFFIGIVVFVIIYYIIKCIKKEFAFSAKSFFTIAFESLLGVGIAAVILLPTYKVLSSTDRISDYIYGVDLISYNDNTIIPKIIQSLFLMPDPLSGGMLFKSKDLTHNWASISLYLPLFTITGVSVFIKNNKHNWITTILTVSSIMALVPGLNSAFTLFNSEYYARWYYMPILIMCLATAKSLDNSYDLKFGIKVEAIGIIALIVVSCLPNRVIKESEKLALMLNKSSEPETEIKLFSMSSIPVVFWQCIAFAVIFLLIVYVYDQKKQCNGILKKITAVTVALIVVTNIIFINNTISQLEFKEQELYDSSIGFYPDIEDNDSYRFSHVSEYSNDNFSILWEKMNAGCFHSIEMNEIDEFYYNIQGEKRMMKSKYSDSDYPIYGLLSVKYIFNPSSGDDLNVELEPVDLTGCSLYDKQGMYYIYKNDHFVPFGVVYDYCIDDETLENYLDENVDADNKYQYKKLAMMRALVLDKEDIDQYSDYIAPLPESMLEGLNEDTYFSDCDDRSADACTEFEYDSKGYRAEITMEKPGIVYFSVPCSDGWTAKVNDKDAEVIKAHYGLTAVAVESGENRIEFSYETPGFREAKTITFISLALLVLYSLTSTFIIKRQADCVKEKNV
jgi:uncharacterized membrane protein YfhO